MFAYKNEFLYFTNSSLYKIYFCRRAVLHCSYTKSSENTVFQTFFENQRFQGIFKAIGLNWMVLTISN